MYITDLYVYDWEVSRGRRLVRFDSTSTGRQPAFAHLTQQQPLHDVLVAAGVGRFDLSSRLVSKNARQAAAELCSNIAAVLQDPQHHSRQAAGSLKHGSQQQAAGTDMLAEPGALAAISCPAAAELQQQHQHDNEWIGKLMHIQSKLHVPE